MKAEKKTNHLPEDADKIEQIPEEKNDGQDEPIKAKKPRKNRILARLRKTWARITGCMRSWCTCIHGERSSEELPETTGSYVKFQYSSEMNMAELPEPRSMKEELPEFSGSYVELQYFSEVNMEELSEPRSMKEELPETSGSSSEMNMEDLKMEDSKDSAEIKEENVEKNHIIKTDKEAEVATNYFVVTELEEEYKRLEAEYQHHLDLLSQIDLGILDEFCKLFKISQSGSNLDKEPSTSDISLEKLQQPCEKRLEAECQHYLDLFSQIDLWIQDEFCKFKISQSGSNLDKEPSTSDISLEKLQQPCEKSPSTSDISLEKHQQPCEKSPSTSDISLEKLQQPCEKSPSTSDISLEKLQQPCEKSPSTSDISLEKLQQPCEKSPSTSDISLEKLQQPCEKSPSTSDISLEKLQQPCEKRLEAECQHYLDLFSQIDLWIQDEFCKFKISQSGSNLDKEPSTSDISLEKLQQPCEKSPSTVPLTIECFKVHRILGAGTYGEVVMATDIIRKERVAIKAIDKCLFTEYEETFTELEILKLSHECPFLTHGLAAFHTEGSVFYVLELAPGGNLRDFIDDYYPLDTPTIQFMIAELICGIQFLHRKNIIHRDLKPANIVLTADGHIKITDFGLALMDVYERTTEEPLGTPAYKAPEMWREQEYGRGVDYFSIGVIMYIMYTNKYPFPNTYWGFGHSILNNTPFYPEFLTPDTVDILQGLLCKNQDYRLGEQGDIRKHPYFSNINWEDVESRRMEPPEAIKMACVVDLNVDEALNYNEGKINIKPEDQKIFKELSFVCADWSQHYHPS